MLNQKNHPIFLCLVMGLTVFSCSPAKEVGYFKTLPRDTTLTNYITRDFEPKIRPDDILSIIVTSPSPEENAKFNGPILASATSSGSNNASGYQVDKAGNIQLYKLGIIHVQGLTVNQLRDKLQKELLPIFKEPMITVRILNHRVTIMGDVSSPQVLSMQNDQMTLLEAISASGDLRPTARRDNILIIRQTEKGKEFKRLNLEDHSVFTSPFFYLQADDVVYVEPEKQTNKQNTQQLVSYIVSGVTLALVILDRVLK